MAELTYSYNVKKEISNALPSSFCCKKAQLYGLLQGALFFTNDKILLNTENENVIKVFLKALFDTAKLDSTDVLIKNKKNGFSAEIVTGKGRNTLFDIFGHERKEIKTRINRANIECEQCYSSYISGLFLSCGIVTNPEANYHIEFSVAKYQLSMDLIVLFREIGIKASKMNRRGNFVVYIKDSEQIEDLLTMMGASNSSLEMMSVKIVKDIRNNVNRTTNCETANIGKTVTAAMSQIDIINKIAQRDGLDVFPTELRKTAEIRLQNPNMSLRELGGAV